MKLWLNHRKYIEIVLQRFNMHGHKLIKVSILVGVKLSIDQCPKKHEEEEEMYHVTYANVVGRLMYEMVCTIPDIAHSMGFLSKYMSKPGKEHWMVVKRVFRYYCGSTNYGIFYQGRPSADRALDTHRFVYTKWARYVDHRRSTSGYVFNLFGEDISWMRKRQYVVTLSNIEVEYIEATHVSKEVVWLQGCVQVLSLMLHCDSQSAIFWERTHLIILRQSTLMFNIIS
jgi:hypothetical protein